MLHSFTHSLSETAKAIGQRVSEATKPREQSGPVIADSRSIVTKACGLEIEGVSIAGQETAIIVPRYKLCFDIGRCPQRAVTQQTVLVSHGHLDHIGGLHFHAASRQMLGLPPSRFIVPPECSESAVKLLELASELHDKTPLEYEVLPVKVGEDYTIPNGGGMIIRPFKTCHTCASQGYIVYSQRRKLKEELAGRSADEIRELRQNGEDVTNTFLVPEIAFTGDTCAEVMELDGLEDVWKAKLLIMELTFIDESVSLEQAREKGHMHIIELVANAHRFQNEAILLTHFSVRYSRAQILQLLEEGLPPALRAKCIPFLNGFQ